MGFLDPVVTINKPLWRRVRMLVGEISYMNDGEELSNLDLDHLSEKFIQRIVDEYIRQYFEESTRSAAEILSRRNQKEQVEPRFWLR